jgi:hypothetical protein
MAGDQGGWFHALWVPIAGVAMAMLIWVWDRVLISVHWPGDLILHISSLFPHSYHSEATAVDSLEFVHSSLYQSAASRDRESPGRVRS